MDKYYDVVREAAPGLPGWTVYRPDESDKRHQRQTAGCDLEQRRLHRDQ